MVMREIRLVGHFPVHEAKLWLFMEKRQEWHLFDWRGGILSMCGIVIREGNKKVGGNKSKV